MTLHERKTEARNARNQIRLGRIRMFDDIAAMAWNESNGHMIGAKAIAKRELKDQGIGFLEVIVLVYCLMKIWALLREMGVMSTTVQEISEMS